MTTFAQRSLVAVSALVLMGAFIYGATWRGADAESTALTREDVEQIVKDTIMKNPQVIIDSLNAMQANEQKAQQERSKEGISKNKDEIFGNANSPVAGNPKGEVVVVEFFDYNCGYCKHMLPVVTKAIEENKDLKVIFKEFPILSETSETAARAALSVYKIAPDKYFEFHSALMSVSGGLNEDVILTIAKDQGLDSDKLKDMMKSDDITDTIKRDRQLASDLGVNGTPAFIIGGELIPQAMPPEAFEGRIKNARKKSD